MMNKIMIRKILILKNMVEFIVLRFRIKIDAYLLTSALKTFNSRVAYFVFEKLKVVQNKALGWLNFYKTYAKKLAFERISEDEFPQLLRWRHGRCAAIGV